MGDLSSIENTILVLNIPSQDQIWDIFVTNYAFDPFSSLFLPSSLLPVTHM